MAAAWDASLPQWFSVAYARKHGDTTVFHKTLSGRPMAYRINAVSIQAINAVFVMTAAQLSTFDTFWETTISGGSLPFQDLNHPETGVNTVWQPQSIPEITPHQGSGTIFDVSWELVALPDAPA